MKLEITLRPETSADYGAIEAITIAAFKTLAVSRHTEQYIVAALRAAQVMTLSLVAVHAGRVVGHVAFSPVTMSDGSGGWYGLGPVSVEPELQRQGIGSALIREGLARLRAMDARGCCLVGDPNYYKRLGFQNASGLSHEGVPPEFFLVYSFGAAVPQGTVAFHEAFTATDWPEGDKGR